MRREPEIERVPGVFEGFFMGTADGGSIIADACTMERSARKGHAAPLRRQSRQGLRRRAFPTGANQISIHHVGCKRFWIYGRRKAQAGSPSAPQSVKKLPKRLRFWYNRGDGGVFTEDWRKDAQ